MYLSTVYNLRQKRKEKRRFSVKTRKVQIYKNDTKQTTN